MIPFWKHALLLVALAAPACSKRDSSPPTKAAGDSLRKPSALPLKPDSVRYIKEPCLGDCPVFTVTFHRNGNAEFHGEKDFSLLGDYVGKIESKDFEELCQKIEQAGLTEMESDYTAKYTDAATTVVEATEGTRTVRVSEYGDSGPEALHEIHALIDRMRLYIPWQPATIR